tara:strand:+ start:129 stop:479 length:351 start_codon:yes stop_codon:yes gene_type:complete
MGQLEAEVMSILWNTDDWLTPRDVLARLESDPPVVYSTVMTILRRLWKKGVVDRRTVGKAFAYHPMKGEGEQTAERMTGILEAAEDPEAALMHFLAGLDARRRRHLRELLDDGPHR